MDDFTIVNKMIGLVAKRNSGKSYLLKYLVDLEKNKFDKIFVICPTESVNKFYSEAGFVDEKCIYDSYDESFVNNLIKKMTEVNKGKKQTDPNFKVVLLILDDCIADTNFHGSNSIKLLYARGRHIGISVIITTQYLKAIPPISRNNTDWMIVGKLNKQGLDILCEEYIKAGMNTKDFIDMYSKNTQDYWFLTINNNSTASDDISEYYGRVKTPKEYF